MGKDKKQRKNQDEKEKSPLQIDLNNSSDLPSGLNKKDKLASKEMAPRKNSKEPIYVPNKEESEDSELEIITLEMQKKKRKKEKKKINFNLLEIEGEDVDFKDDTIEEKLSVQLEDTLELDKSESKTPKSGKKSKKKERKKKEGYDEEVEKILEELALEETGGAKNEKVKDKTTSLPDSTAETPISEDVSENQKSEVQKKKKKKKSEISSENLELEITPSKEPSPEGDEELSTVKTAAQKKKEKKEREKQKKMSQYEQSATKKKPEKVSEKVESVAENEVVEDQIEIEDEENVDDKKKKKKKKGTEEEKKDKKRPGKKQIAAMQEALKKVKEEEERLRLEEEAKIKAAEEAERLRLEKLRIEQEKKERKKQKEKEKRERLRAEGKLLTKAQKQSKARMEATLAILRQQGIDVPQIGEKKEKGPRLGDRIRGPKKKMPIPEKTVEVPKIEPEITTPDKEIPVEQNEEGKKSPSIPSEEENIKDAWYETTSDEDDSEQGKAPSKLEISAEKKKVNKTKSDSEMESSSSEESSSEEEETESEEESSESEDDDKKDEASIKEKIKLRIQKRRELAESNRSESKLRSPVVCVLGHVDTGKTKILDKIRSSNVQDNEAGGITQQIGATMVPQEALKDQCKMVKNFAEMELKIPGLLIIDTPGHESFSNLRSRGSSLCDIAILVVDITHGLEPQTIESINLLKQKKTPFVVALNKIDRVYDWKPNKNKDIQDDIKGQSRPTKQFFEDRVKQIILEFANQSLNAVLYYENTDPRSYISLVPTSALTGEGMGNLLALIVELTQTMMSKRLQFSEELQATVLEVKAISGLGHTMDVILVNGKLKEGDTIIFAGYDGPVCSQIRSLLMPQPLKELRIKTQFVEYKEVEGAQGVKITGKDLDKAIAGLPLLVPRRSDETKSLMEEISTLFQETLNSIKVTGQGVYVQTSTLGSLEALMEFLNESKIPVSGVRIGPVTKKDVMKASAMLEHDSTYAVILAFDVKIEREAQELADSLNIKIFHANIIYHLFDMFVNYRTEIKERNRELYKNEAVFPCKLRILPQFIFNSRDPIVVGVSVEAGIVKEGTPLCVPTKEFLEIGIVSTIEVNHKPIESARKGQEVCIKIEPCGGDAPKMYGRHFDHTDLLVSKISRRSIDLCKEHFRDDLLKTDWQLIVELKKLFQIL